MGMQYEPIGCQRNQTRFCIFVLNFSERDGIHMLAWFSATILSIFYLNQF